MSVNLTVNGTTYAYPSTGDEQWGTVATNWASAVTSGMLQKAGGTFTLTADANFGASFGLLAAYFSTRSSTPSTSGQFRMANADTGIGWRNAANSGNLLLTVDSSNRLTYNGIVLSGSSALTASRVMATDASGFPTVATTTTTQVQYLASATGSTGTASTNIVFSASPTLTGTVTFSTLQSSSSNVATAGSLRLSNTEAIDWRNAANSTNAALTYSASDRLTLDGVNIPTISSTDTFTNKTLTSPTINGATVSGTFDGNLTLASSGNIAIFNSTNIKLKGSATNKLLVPEATSDSDGLQLYVTGSTNFVYAGTSSSLSLGANSVAGATINTSGAVTIRGTVTNDSAAAGFVGEYVESLVTPGTSVPNSTTQYGDLTSISLTAGDWDVSLLAQFGANGATVTALEIGISVTSGNSSTGLTYGQTDVVLPNPSGSQQTSGAVPVFRKSISSTTTVYAKTYSAYTVATPTYGCRLSARRVR